MEEMIPCSIKDQEVFQRVWQRVMAGRDGAQCSLEAMPPNMQGDLSCECLEALVQQQDVNVLQPAPSCPGGESPAPEEPMPQPPVEEPPMPEPPVEEPFAPDCPQAPAEPDTLPKEEGCHRGYDLPQLWEGTQDETDRTARLRRHVMDALEGWQFYRHLARRARGTDARVLNGLAGELHRSARKLSAAYFLLTGLRYWPSELLCTPAIPSYWGALRTRHQAEQHQETAYRMASDDWDDADMQDLYTELIEACQKRCRQLRTLLEQDFS